jgi:hypothetical protein
MKFLYTVIQKEWSIFWEEIVSVIVGKILYERLSYSEMLRDRALCNYKHEGNGKGNVVKLLTANLILILIYFSK